MFSISKKISEFRKNRAYQLPKYRCSKWIEVCGPEYKDQGFLATFEVEVSKILSWANKKDYFPWVFYDPYHVAKELLPQWLNDANFKDDSVTKLDQFQRKILTERIFTFVEMKAVRAYCKACKKYHSNFIKETLNVEDDGVNASSTDNLLCQNKHLLSTHHYEVHRNIRSTNLDKPSYLRNK
jgi:hypothetical protein